MKARVFAGVFLVTLVLLTASAGLVIAAGPGRSDQGLPAEGQQELTLVGFGRSSYSRFVSVDLPLANVNSNIWVTALSTPIGLSAAGCITVQYSGEAVANGLLPDSFKFRAVLNGVPMNFPYVWFDPAQSNIYDLASFTWWKCGVPVGNHTVAVQFQPAAGHSATVRQRTLRVEY